MQPDLVIGHSMGGRTAAGRPERLRRSAGDRHPRTVDGAIDRPGAAWLSLDAAATEALSRTPPQVTVGIYNRGDRRQPDRTNVELIARVRAPLRFVGSHQSPRTIGHGCRFAAGVRSGSWPI